MRRALASIIIRKWDPRRLQSALALWIDPSDVSTMAQSNAGTTMVTDASVCGYAGDKSGNAFHLTSVADDTTRPTWNNNGGFPYLNFDGSNDVLRRTASLGLYAAGAAAVFIAVRGNPAVARCLVSEGDATGTSFVLWVANDATTASTTRYAQKNDAGATPVDVAPNTGVWDNTDKVFGLIDDGTRATGYVNGVAGTPQTATRSGVYTIARFGLGALQRNTPAIFFAARVYGLIGVTRVPTAQEIANITTYLGAKMGLTL